MGRIVVSENISLDGVVEVPLTSDDSGTGDWFAGSDGPDLAAWAQAMTAEAQEAQALLLGRRSDAWFAARWADRTGEWADRLNALPKYVVSGTLERGRWTGATVLGGDPVEEVARLRREIDGDVVVYGSIRLVRTLLEHHLVDELRLVVFPAVAGGGERLFDGLAGGSRLRLRATATIGAGIVQLTYAPADPG